MLGLITKAATNGRAGPHPPNFRVLGRPTADYAIEQLARAGARSVFLAPGVAHTAPPDTKITVYQMPKPRTGLLDLLGRDDLVVWDDSLFCAKTIDLPAMVQAHQRDNATATLLVGKDGEIDGFDTLRTRRLDPTSLDQVTAFQEDPLGQGHSPISWRHSVFPAAVLSNSAAREIIPRLGSNGDWSFNQVTAWTVRNLRGGVRVWSFSPQEVFATTLRCHEDWRQAQKYALEHGMPFDPSCDKESFETALRERRWNARMPLHGAMLAEDRPAAVAIIAQRYGPLLEQFATKFMTSNAADAQEILQNLYAYLLKTSHCPKPVLFGFLRWKLATLRIDFLRKKLSGLAAECALGEGLGQDIDASARGATTTAKPASVTWTGVRLRQLAQRVRLSTVEKQEIQSLMDQIFTPDEIIIVQRLVAGSTVPQINASTGIFVYKIKLLLNSAIMKLRNREEAAALTLLSMLLLRLPYHRPRANDGGRDKRIMVQPKIPLLEVLPAGQRQVLENLLQGKSQREAASKEGVTEAAICHRKRHLLRSLKQLAMDPLFCDNRDLRSFIEMLSAISPRTRLTPQQINNALLALSEGRDTAKHPISVQVIAVYIGCSHASVHRIIASDPDSVIPPGVAMCFHRSYTNLHREHILRRVALALAHARHAGEKNLSLSTFSTRYLGLRILLGKWLRDAELQEGVAKLLTENPGIVCPKRLSPGGTIMDDPYK